MKAEKACVIFRAKCLTNFTFEHLRLPREWRKELFTEQRVDYAVGLSDGTFTAEPKENVRPFTRLHAWDFDQRIKWQNRDILSARNVKMLVLDDFPEAFESVFVNRRTGARFCSLFGALDRNEDFWNAYSSSGRLLETEFERIYRDFFNRVEKSYGKIPIVFLCFSARLDSRPDYKRRIAAADVAILKVAEDFPNLHVYRLDFVARRSGDDKHPYHYSEETYLQLARRIASAEPELRLAFRCPDWLTRIARFFYEKRKGDQGVRTVRILGLTFSYVTRRKRGKAAE